MSRISRSAILADLHAKANRQQPIIGGSAGSGLAARCEEAGGIDLIAIYNSGRYRMAGRGSLAGLLAYGNANEIVCEMAHEVLPAIQRTPVLAGVNGTDPFMLRGAFLKHLMDLGFSGIQNFPTVGLIDGRFREGLERTGMGYGQEVELIREAHAMELVTAPYVFDAEQATAMAWAGADLIVCHMGPSPGDGKKEPSLDRCVELITRWAKAAKTVNPYVLVLCHGGPIESPDDVRFILRNCKECHGFYGASSIEQLPAEAALIRTTRDFKSITF